MHIKNICLMMVLILSLLMPVLASPSRAEGPEMTRVPAMRENQVYDQVATFQEFFNPNDYKWEGTWDPRFNQYGLPKLDRDYDRSVGEPRQQRSCEW